MMMRSPGAHRKDKKGRAKTLSSITAVVALIVLLFLFRGGVGAVLRTVLSPVWGFEFFLLGSLEDAARILATKKTLIDENIALKRKIESYDEVRRGLDDAIRKNERLEAMLGRSSGKSTMVAGVVLHRPPYTFYDTLLIDVGRNDAVDVGDSVFTEEGSLAGDITEVHERTALVSLLSMPGRKSEVLIGDSMVPAEAEGRGGGNFIVILPVDVDVVFGDEVRVPSLGPSVLGVVEHVDVDSADSIQTVYFKNVFNISDLDIVEVKTKN